MIVQHFLKWVDTARVPERAAAASALARAYIMSDLAFEDRCGAEAALTLLLDDPSPKVRLALAEALSLSARAPAQIVHALSCDQPEVAAMVILRSPLLTDADLIDRVAAGDGASQRLVAMRPSLSMSLAAAIAEVGEAAACVELLNNAGADIASLSFARMAERHGHLPSVREAMLGDSRLPAGTRHMLLVKLGEALRTAPLVLALMGKTRAERVTREACINASLTLIDRTPPEEHAALVGHLRLRGDLTAGFLIRAVAHGKIDFFGAALGSLAGKDAARVRSLLANGREVALSALFRAAGLGENVHGVILAALKVWRAVANGKRVAGAQEVSWLMLKELNAAPGQSGPAEADRELAALLKRIHLDALRENARGHALAIAAA
jgi:uncharacterized protein (DUF2336 family)